MYYYYYATAGGARIWVSIVVISIPSYSLIHWIFSQWKKYLTTMQIVQFVIDLFAVYFGSMSSQDGYHPSSFS